MHSLQEQFGGLLLLFQQEITHINIENLHFLNTFQSHVLVSVIGDAFQASKKEESVRGGRDLIVEALRHKVSSTLYFTLLSELASEFILIPWFSVYLNGKSPTKCFLQ